MTDEVRAIEGLQIVIAIVQAVMSVAAVAVLYSLALIYNTLVAIEKHLRERK